MSRPGSEPLAESSAGALSPPRPARNARWSSWWALGLLGIGVACLGWFGLDVRTAWGWDETMHAELPAARMLLHLRRGEVSEAFDVLLACDQYPFVWPVVLATAQWLFGLGEAVARSIGWIAYALLLAVTGRLAWSAARGTSPELESRAAVAPLALTALATSPLALGFAPLLFLELPAALSIALAALAWLWAWSKPHPARATCASALAAAAFFTKFNYGALLLLALGVDQVLRLVLLRRDPGQRAPAARSALIFLWLPLCAALVWWFVWPFPANGAGVAAAHRAAFMAWMAGNQEQVGLPAEMRLLYTVGQLCNAPSTAVWVVIGWLATARLLTSAAVRTLWIVTLALLVPALVHPFHLERFLLPAAPTLYALAALGWARIALNYFARLRPAARIAIAVVPLGVGYVTAPAQTAWLAWQLGIPAQEAQKPYVRSVIDGWSHPNLRRRHVGTVGLDREELRQILDQLSAAIGPDERVGWCGSTQELSPCALHLGLLARGGSVERFLAEAHRDVLFLNAGVEPPGVTAEDVLRWASRFDVVVLTDPPDLKGRARQAFQGQYQAALRAGGWEAATIFTVDIARPPQGPTPVTFEVRRKR